jgi:hypothetical protein
MSKLKTSKKIERKGKMPTYQNAETKKEEKKCGIMRI